MPLRNLIIIAVAILVSLACYTVAAKNRYANLFAEAMQVVDTEALHEVPRQTLFASAMTGMLKELDEHSSFISGDNYRAFDEDMKQEFGGVGMYVETNPETNRLFVLAPMPGTPAFKAGMQIGDEIIAIDGENVEGKTRAQAVKLLRGPVNAPVELTVERGRETITKRMVRAVIPVPSVHGDYRDKDGTWRFVLKSNPRIGYIRLDQFGEKSGDEIKTALKQLDSNVDALILDLRNNSGGLLDVAVEICDFFLNPDDLIVSTRGRGGKLLKPFSARAPPIVHRNLPIVVLVNRNSASASEILAGCLQDHKRAVIVGEQTYGKGTVQNVIPMQRGESALKLTTASYWRPSGRNIDRHDPIAQQTKVWGVQPDDGLQVEMTEEEVFDNLRFRSIRDLEDLYPGVNSQTLNRLKRLRWQTAQPDLDSDGDANPETDLRPLLKDDQANEASNADTANTENKPLTDGDIKPDTPKPDLEDPDQTINDMDQPHTDRPMERAIEYLKTVLTKTRVAA